MMRFELVIHAKGSTTKETLLIPEGYSLPGTVILSTPKHIGTAAPKKIHIPAGLPGVRAMFVPNMVCATSECGHFRRLGGVEHQEGWKLSRVTVEAVEVKGGAL